MKKAKLVAIAAAMATALLVAFSSSAMAATGDTVLCKSASGPCPVASQYAANTSFTAKLKTGATSNLNSSLDNVTCTASAVTLKNTAQSGTPLPGQITALTFTGCTDQYGNSCTVTVNNLPYGGSALAGSTAGNGTLTLNTANVNVKCGSIINCTFTAPSSGITGSFTGGNPATVQFSSAPLNNTGGGFCPSTATYSSTYVTTGSNAAVWLEKSS